MFGIKIIFPEKHYLIMSNLTKTAIGCCWESSIENVMEEETDINFVKVRQKKCPICNKQ